MPKTTTANARLEHSLDLLRKGMQAQGYTEGAPPWLDLEDLTVDERVAQHLVCGCCKGRRTFKAYPFFKTSTGGYKSMCLCQKCGAIDEL